MQKYFTNFVMKSNPNGPGLPHFQTYGEDTISLDLNLTSIGPIKDDTANERCYWWQKGLYY